MLKWKVLQHWVQRYAICAGIYTINWDMNENDQQYMYGMGVASIDGTIMA